MKYPMQHRFRKLSRCGDSTAFTLIELLVVITIIVVLLALLTPALDKAIYRAELLNCGGKLKAMASGVQLYAFENKRYYPDRTMRGRQPKQTGQLPISPMTIYHPTVNYDMRPLHRQIFSINDMMQCPMSPQIELENTSVEEADITLAASYNMFWAWQYKREDKTFAGMFKVGDRFAYDDVLPFNPPKLNRFSILAGDIDLSYQDGDQGSHPDRDGVMAELQAEGEIFIGRNSVARWKGPRGRGLIDNNFAFDDGSVSLYTDVDTLNAPRNRRHPDMTLVTINFDDYNNRGAYVDKLQVPLR